MVEQMIEEEEIHLSDNKENSHDMTLMNNIKSMDLKKGISINLFATKIVLQHRVNSTHLQKKKQTTKWDLKEQGLISSQPEWHYKQ